MKRTLLVLLLFSLCISTGMALERELPKAMQQRVDRAKEELTRMVPLEIMEHMPENALPARAYQLYRFIQRAEGDRFKADSREMPKRTSSYLEQRIITSENWDAGAWVNSTRNTMTFNSDEFPLTMFGERWLNSMWQPSSRTTFTYDTHGNSIEYLWEVDFTGTGVLTPFSRWTATVDGSGFITEMVYQNWSGTAWVNTGRDLFNNDANGWPIETLSQNWNGSGWDNSDKYITTYDSNGNITEDIHQIWINSSWDNSWRWTATFNAQQNTIFDLWQEWDGSVWVNSTQSLYEYDGSGNLTVWTGQSWNGSSWDNDWRDLWTYSGSDPTEYITQIWDGSVWENFYRETYVFPTGKMARPGNIRYPELEVGYIWSTSLVWAGAWQVTRSLIDVYHPDVETYQDADPYPTSPNNSVQADDSGSLAWVNSSRNTFEYTQSAGIEDDTLIPESFTLSNYPNPFNPETTIHFDLPTAAELSVTIYDINGAEIRTLTKNQTFQAGSHQLNWDGMDKAGRKAASGIYLYRLQSEHLNVTRRCVLMK